MSGPPTSHQLGVHPGGSARSDPPPTMTALTATSRPTGLTTIVVLAFVQAAVGIFWAVRWFYLAGQLRGAGGLPPSARGSPRLLASSLRTIIALLYLAFVVGASAARDWAWGVGYWR